MLDTMRQLILNQFEAALCTLNACIQQCPDSQWNARVGTHPFCRVAFHTLFFTDFYLEPGDESDLRQQQFHQLHADYFRDYEELEDRDPAWLYDRPTTLAYLRFCREKVARVVGDETAESFCDASGFRRRPCSRAELHVYSMRHIQHHAAQLSLRLRLSCNEAVPWIAHAWRDEQSAHR